MYSESCGNTALLASQDDSNVHHCRSSKINWPLFSHTMAIIMHWYEE
jgi:hypothetical protein